MKKATVSGPKKKGCPGTCLLFVVITFGEHLLGWSLGYSTKPKFWLLSSPKDSR